LDERHLKIIEIQDFSAVPYTKQDKSQVKRQLLALNRKGKFFIEIYYLSIKLKTNII
jgi:hypothetical protein